MIKLHASTDKQYYFTLVARNGQVLMTSETYKTKANRMRGVKAFIRAAKIVVGELGEV